MRLRIAETALLGLIGIVLEAVDEEAAASDSSSG